MLHYSRSSRRREITLGNHPALTLAEARKKTRALRARIDAGEDPATDRTVAKARAHAALTISKLCDDFAENRFPHLSESSVKQYAWLIATVIKPAIGSLDVHIVRPSDIVYMIERSGHPWSICKVLLSLSRKIFARAVGRRLIDANPATGIDRKAIKGEQPPTRRRVMLMENELRKLLPGIDDRLGRQDGLMFRIVLATCVRQSELIRSKKLSVDLERKAWRVQSGTIKTRQEFLVPLAPLVAGWMRELTDMAGESESLCPARNPYNRKGHVGRCQLQHAVRRAFERGDFDIRRFTPHDTRSTAKGHLRNLGFSREISEIALNHKLPGLEGIYDVREEIPERRTAMEAWAQFIEKCCDNPAPDEGGLPGTSNVIPFRPRHAA